jgi:hypothetical protein
MNDAATPFRLKPEATASPPAGSQPDRPRMRVVVENVTRIEPGEGLRKAASAGPTAFRIVIPDPVSQQVDVDTVH